jgi:hypothetical protein
MTTQTESTDLVKTLYDIMEEVNTLPKADGTIQYSDHLRKKRKEWLNELERVRPIAAKAHPEHGRMFARLHFKVRRLTNS